MTKAERQATTEARFDSWGRQLAEAHATPFILIGVGHEPASAGEFYVCIPMDTPGDRALMAQVLRKVLAAFETKG